ncbi:MAG TPA: hypothetical protein VLF89_05415 [Candidatus Saccharimonadales bacterium]|nr:hypothetical protein [Candidatus Saccharimonadales bacterium]
MQRIVPDRVVIFRLNSDKASFHKSVTDIKNISDLYYTISQLPLLPTITPFSSKKPSINEQITNLKQYHTCPFSTGVTYNLSFYQKNTLLSTVIWKPWGVCSTVKVIKDRQISELDGSKAYNRMMSDVMKILHTDKATITCTNRNAITHVLSC